jgi:hypothetical protein
MLRGQFENALKYSDIALSYLEPLVIDEEQWEFDEYIGSSQFEKAAALEALGRPLEALKEYGEARERLSELVLHGGRGPGKYSGGRAPKRSQR